MSSTSAANAPPADTSDMNAAQLRKHLSKYALPSANELQHLQSADPTASHRSSFFRMQTEELLSRMQVKPSSQNSEGLQKVLFQVKDMLLDTPENSQVTSELLEHMALPIRNFIKRKEIVLSFSKPSRVDVIGSFILGTMAHSNSKKSEAYGDFTIDLAVEMPSECFLPKDFSNYRYFDKRNLYVGVLLSRLQQDKSGLFSDVQLADFQGDTGKPILSVKVAPKMLKSLGIKYHSLVLHVHPVISPEDTFKLAKLAPSRNNIRHEATMSESEMQACNTPLYNTSILEDMMLKRHSRELHTACSSDNFKQACVLLRIWLRQRQFHKAMDSLNGFHLSMLLLYLFEQGRVNQHTPPDQMFKVLMQFLVSHDIQSTPLMFSPADDGVALTEQGISVFQEAFDTVLLDSSGRLNLLARVTMNAYKEVQHAAKESLDLLHRGSSEDFQALFIQKRPFWTRFDEYFWFPSPVAVDESDETTYTKEEKRQINDLGLERFWRRKLESLVTRALTDRVHLVSSYSQKAVTWKGSMPESRPVAIGVVINKTNASRIVDKGPSADDKQASREFQVFWKGKSELRRFKDGAIVEAVVWEEVTSETRHRLLELIVRYITAAHCPQLTSSSHIKGSNAPLHALVDHSLRQGNQSGNLESSMTSVNHLWVVFNRIAKQIRSLETLPLSVSDVQPVHPCFRYTSVIPPTPHPLAYSKGEKKTSSGLTHATTVLEPLQVFVKFERSSSWPSEAKALEHAKMGFYVHMAHELERSCHLRCEATKESVDVFSGGFAFRLSITSDNEVSVVSGQKKLDVLQSTAFVRAKQRMQYLPQHANGVQALHTKSGSYGPTVRLLQKWIATNHLSNSFSQQVLELLVAHVFTTSSPHSVPSSMMSGFMRTLKLISSHDWQTMPLIASLDDPASEDKSREMTKRFEASATKPSTHPAMFIAATYEDMECLSSWTRSSPSRVVVQRLQSLAKMTYEKGVAWLSGGLPAHGWHKAFHLSAPADFDVVIDLQTNKLPSKTMKTEKKQAFSTTVYSNMRSSDVELLPGFDPVHRLVQDIESRFGSLLLVFVDVLEKDQIMLLWKPPAFVPKKRRPLEANGMLPLDRDNKFESVPNVFEILSEIKGMGDGMIERVQVAPFE